MRINRILLLCMIVTVTLLVACSEKKYPTINDFYRHFPLIEDRKPTILPFNASDFKKPISIFYDKQKVYLTEDNALSDTLLSVFDLKNFRPIGSFIQKGNGLNGFIEITNLQKQSDRYFFYDWSSKKIVNFVFEKDTIRIVESIKIKADSIIHSIFNVFPSIDHNFLATGILPQHRIAVIDRALARSTHAFGVYPVDKRINSTYTALAFAHQSIIIVNEDLKKCAVFGKNEASYSFYDIKNINKPQMIINKVFVFPTYHDNGNNIHGSVVFDKELTTQGVLSVTKSTKYCICLYSGEVVNHIDNFFYADKLLVFDWNGNPIKIIRLGARYSSITYDEEKNLVYLLGLDPISFDYTISAIKI